MDDDIKNEEKANQQIEDFLPDALRCIMASYENFIKFGNSQEALNENVEDVKNFIEFHKACKVALTNIEILLKFYKLVEKKENTSDYLEQIKSEVKAAEKRISDDLNKIPLK